MTARRRGIFVMLVPAAIAIVEGCSSFESSLSPAVEEAGVVDAGPQDAPPIPDAVAPCSSSLETDPNNCGACGRSCLGSACENGKCIPQRIGKAINRVSTIAVTPKGVHWIIRGVNKLWKCPIEGCTTDPVELSNALVDPQGIVAVGDDLAVLCSASIQRVTPAGGTTPIYGDFTQGTHIAVTSDDGFIYFKANETALRLLRVRIDGSMAGRVVETSVLDSVGAGKSRFAFVLGVPDTIAVCDDVGSCGMGRGITTFTGELPTVLAVTSTDVFYARPNELGKCALTGCGSSRTILATESNVQEVAVDATHFWFLRRDKGELVRCPHSGCGGQPEVVAKTGHSPEALLVTDDASYWTAGGPLGDGGFEEPFVYRLAK
jgi:hypothetical protein